MLRAFADAARVNRLTHSPLGGKYALVWVLERIIGKPCLVTSQMAPRFPLHGDIENTAHHAWRSRMTPSASAAKTWRPCSTGACGALRSCCTR